MTSPHPQSFRPAANPELRAHQQWIGFVQPVGLIVSLPALEKAQCYVNRNVVREQLALIALVAPKDKTGEIATNARVDDLRALCRDVLGWEDGDLLDPPESLEVALPEYGEILKPTYAVPAPQQSARYVALVSVVPGGTDLDKPRADVGWQASSQTRLERLLRENDVPIGLLFNGSQLRLVYSPRGESSGHVTFNVLPMCEPSGRPILGAMHMLLSGERLFSLAESQRLPSILKDSRRYQNEVSTALSEQVLAALYELLRGFQAANEVTHRELLGEVLRENPNHVYGGLLATLLRLVFVLYAEDRALLPQDSVYGQSYSVTALFEKLREDVARYPDTMDQRFGAWARLIALFRLIHDGGGHGTLHLPPRYGRLFDPDSYPFLEGRPYRDTRQLGVRLSVPRVSDGVLYRVLDNLLLLEGDRLSYRALDVEQIGSVYEAMMGFAIEVATEPSIGLHGRRKPGAPAADPVVGLTSLLAAKPADRLKVLDEAGVDVAGKIASAIKDAKSQEELILAFGKKISPFTPEVVPASHMVLQPTEERRRSGSHYTPRALTEPIVATTLRPLFDAMGGDPTPEQIIALKICDPAMGSGAFLVAACRALGDKLVAAWQRHGYLELGKDGQPPRVLVPADEDPVLHARRVVAQRCLYGVDKNPFAVDLAKLSLWLVTLAKDHPFTFLDHALRQGDSLVGLSREQIASFHWVPKKQVPLLHKTLEEMLSRAQHLRARIHEMGDSDDTREKQRLLRDADDALATLRRVANLVIDAFFEGKNAKEREARLATYRQHLETRGIEGLPDAPEAEKLTPFHWEIEFPEVFSARAAGAAAALGGGGAVP
jgi:hypothetical protein